VSYERITYPNFSSIKPIPPKKGYRKIKKRANYRYDALNRITSGIDNTGNYNLTNVAYDKNGNITNLERKGHTNVGATSFGVMDNLVYTYETNSNKLKKVLDNGNDTYGFKDVVNLTTEYVYDANGNLVKDLNKGIGTSSVNGITYNHLNLPIEIKFDNNNDKKINYTYDATGVKLKKVVNDGGSLTTTDYANGYIYENNTLQFFNHPEGYVHNNNGTFKYVYNYLDHLGSIRLSYSDGDGNGSISQSEIIKENHYYPYGLKMRGFNSNVSSLGNSVAKKYMFNGKEFDESFNETLNTYDFGARNYDPALGRWMNLDPLAEQMRRHSPYNYAFNNPTYFIDPDGMKPEDIYKLDKKSGEINLVERNDDKTDTLVDSDDGSTISENVDKGLLSDGQNIKKYGLQTSNVKGGGKLAVDISMKTNEEIVAIAYKNESGDKYLEVRPYEGGSVVRNDEGQVVEMVSGSNQKVESTFTSSDGSFTGKPIYSVHTHPGHPDGVDYIGDPTPSGSDLNIARMNRTINKVDIPFYIIGSKPTTINGKTSNRVRYDSRGNVRTVDPPKKN